MMCWFINIADIGHIMVAGQHHDFISMRCLILITHGVLGEQPAEIRP